MKKMLLIASAVVLSSTAFAQSAFDAYRLSQPDLKGTARFMSMGGAFTALGGDLSCISQNPGGIGIYRNSEIGLTVDLDVQNSTSQSEMFKNSVDQTKFLLNNVGFIWTLKLASATCPNINFGFTYNKTASFNRRYRGAMNLHNSLSNFIAADASYYGYSADQLYDQGLDDPYYNSNASWLSILAYNAYLIAPDGNPKENHYIGQWKEGKTSGTGIFDVIESGGVDSYNIAIGGNIKNLVFWGMDFDITHMNYNLNTGWGESLDNAIMLTESGYQYMYSDWMLRNSYNCSGTGFNFKLGFIVKPIQELRLGFSFHTPTWYGMTETYRATINYDHGGYQDATSTNYGTPAYNDFNFSTPWKINAGIAGVLFNRLILSADYEWAQYSGMKFSTPSYSWDPWDEPNYYPYIENGNVFSPTESYGAYSDTNTDIKKYYRSTNTFRLGAEFRILPQLSIRAGYSHVSSPVASYLKNNNRIYYTAGTIPNYRTDNSTNYITCGLGYKIGSFYIDGAYVYKHMDSEYHAYSPDPENGIPSPSAKLSLNNSQIILSAGFKF